MVILSGLILFSDKVTTFGITETYGFNSTKTFIWVITQTLSPLLLCFGGLLKPYKISYSAPLYFYFIQLYWVFNAKELGLDDVLLHIYAIGFTISTFVVVLSVIWLFSKIKSFQTIKIENLNNTIRSFFVFMYKEAEEKDLIKPEKSLDFRRMRMELTDNAAENE